MKKLIEIIIVLPAYLVVGMLFIVKMIFNYGEYLSEKVNELGGENLD